MATRKTTATQFSAKTVFTICGKISKISGTCVKPMPILKESAAMVNLDLAPIEEFSGFRDLVRTHSAALSAQLQAYQTKMS